MSSLDFELRKLGINYDTTLINVADKNTEYMCLLDTGAYLAIWCAGYDEFKVRFPNHKTTNYCAFIGGFGYGKTAEPIAVVSQYKLSDGKNTVVYHDFPIVVMNRADFSFQMVLGYSLFRTANIAINTYSKQGGLHDIIPHILLNYKHNDVYVKAINYLEHEYNDEVREYLRRYPKCEGILKHLSVFTQS